MVITHSRLRNDLVNRVNSPLVTPSGVEPRTIGSTAVELTARPQLLLLILVEWGILKLIFCRIIYKDWKYELVRIPLGADDSENPARCADCTTPAPDLPFNLALPCIAFMSCHVMSFIYMEIWRRNACYLYSPFWLATFLVADSIIS